MEYELLVELAPLPSQTSLPNTYSTLINPLIALFSTTLSSLGSLIKRSLHKNTFLALSVYGNLSSLQSRWDDLMCRRPGRKENELKDSLHSIRNYFPLHGSRAGHKQNLVEDLCRKAKQSLAAHPLLRNPSLLFAFDGVE